MKKEWYPLDNAANIYPVIQTKTWTSMFRLVALMSEPVDRPALQRALDKMRPRFKAFYVRLRRGIFWYYLEQIDNVAKVERDTLHICPPIEKAALPFRVKVHNDRISCEFAHYITDGGGGASFFQTLLAQYCREIGDDVPVGGSILDLNAESTPADWKDGFRQYSRMGARPGRRETRAYHPSGTRLPPGMQIITTGTLRVGEALALAREHKVSVTEYMTAMLIYVLYRIQLSERHRNLQPVKVSVPVNLRKYYPTSTLKNFSQYLNPGIDPNLGDFTFEETLEQVHHYFHYMYTEKNLNARISKNVGDETNMALRLIPLLIKKLGIRLVYEMTGEALFSSVISNLGIVDLPNVMRNRVLRVDLLLATARRNVIECGMASYEDALSVSFTRTIAEPYVEGMFFRMLVKQGLHVKVESNQL